MLNNQTDIISLLSKKESLHEDLKIYLECDGNFPMLRHPLIFSVPYFEGENALINERYKIKKEIAEKTIKDKKFESYIYLHERPHRINAFLEIEKNLDDIKYWEILSEIWTDSENIWQNKEQWKQLLSLKRKHRKKFMSEEDHKIFNDLPDTLIVYRGYNKGKNKDGFSYTLDREKAEWFSNRFNGKGTVYSRKIKKTDIFAFTNRRGENEIIII